MPANQGPTTALGVLWLHEIKHDGFRVVARKDGARVKLYSRPGFSPVLEETDGGQRLTPLVPETHTGSTLD